MSEVKTKICTKCGKELPATEEYFHVHKDCKYGLNSRCKNCHNKCSIEWAKKNSDRVNKSARIRRSQNPNKNKEYLRSWRDKNPGKAVGYVRKWKDKNPDKERERDKKCRMLISDRYVKGALVKDFKISRKNIPPELIELKREQIKLHRKIYSS